MELATAVVQDVVRRALEEDLGEGGDLTTRLCVPPDKRASARILARESGVLAGLPVAVECLRVVDPEIDVELVCQDGDAVEPDRIVLKAIGRASSLLAAERTALNLLQRLSGIATRTREFVDAVGPERVRILDTRKTTPGLRALEKYAVRRGGGENHRFGLFDQVMLKENHFALAARPVEEVVRIAVDGSDAPVVAEARNVDEALAAVRGGAHVVMLDNFAPGDELRRVADAVRSEAQRLERVVEVEASGGIRLDNVRDFAASGVDRVSVGALTHSVRSLDLSMLMEEVV